MLQIEKGSVPCIAALLVERAGGMGHSPMT